MKITNETNYSTRHLRKIFLACEKNEGTDPKHRNVKVIYGRKCGTRGYAWYNSNSVVMKLPKSKEVDKVGWIHAKIHEVAQVYIHEVGHNFNLRHSEMMDWWDIPVDFIEDGKVDLKVACSPKISAAEKNEEKARKKLAEWEKKMNKAKTFVKKYRQKVKYYDKKKEKAMV
jgi:hypothetical protein